MEHAPIQGMEGETMTQHGSDLPAGVLAGVERLERERRDLDTELRSRVQSLIDTARREGFDVGFRAGKDATNAYNHWRGLA
jgi:hypothetical protein